MSDYYYKGYDIESKSRLEKFRMEYTNPYGYNLDCNERRVNNVSSVTHPNQDLVKNNWFKK